MRATASVLLAPLLALWSCARPPLPPPSAAHYTLGAPYETGGVWQYPRADFAMDITGLAAVAPAAHPRATADGEAYDATAMAAAHRTLQLPAVARVTNLDAGLSALVRLNDRGPASPKRLVEVTPRVAQVLQIQDGSRIRLQVAEGPSRQAVAGLEGSSPHLDIATAPAAAVTTESLPPPGGVASASHARTAATLPTSAAVAVDTSSAVPLRLPEQVTREPVRGGALYVTAGGFSRAEYARLMQRRLAGLGAEVATDYSAPRDRAFVLRLGPFASSAEADAAFERALHAGVTDPSIVVGP